MGHALLNAVDETASSSTSVATTIKSQQLQPFLEIGKPSGNGFNLAFNGGYDFVAARVAIWRRAGGLQLGLLRA